MSVERAQHEISSREFTEWLAYYQLEPFGETIADLRHGVATAAMANFNRNSKDKPEPYKALDFIPWADRLDDEDDDALIFLDDPEALSALIRAKVFHLVPESNNSLE